MVRDTIDGAGLDTLNGGGGGGADSNGDAVANMTMRFTGDVTALTGTWVL